MTMRLDIMTNDAGELVRRERARELGADVVVELYKLLKQAAVHDLQNQAFQQQLERTHQKIAEYTIKSGLDVSILFAHKAVFVAGQLLRGSRSVYEAAVELGDMMARVGGSDVLIDREITARELLLLTEAVGQALRNSNVEFRSPTPRFRLRMVKDAARLRGLELEQLSSEERIVRGYASAVVVMRRFFEDLSESHYTIPRRLKRVAQTLVDLSTGNVPMFLGVTEARNANFDDAGKAVNSAILAVAMARKLTDDAIVLSKIAIAALVHDAARPRALALAAQGEFGGGSSLSEDQEDELPRGTAAVLSALGRLNEASIHRTVISFEAQWLRRQTYLGLPYDGERDPLVHARIIALARRFNDAATPEPGLAPKPADYAIAILDREFPEPMDKLLLRVLAETIRVLPMGTVVQLTSGQICEVETPTSHSERPIVRVLEDARGVAPRTPTTINLQTTPNEQIVRVLDTSGWQKGLSLGEQFDVDDSPHGPDSDMDDGAGPTDVAPKFDPFSQENQKPFAPPPKAEVAWPAEPAPPASEPLELDDEPIRPSTAGLRAYQPDNFADEAVQPSRPGGPTSEGLVIDEPLIMDEPLVEGSDPVLSIEEVAFELPPPSSVDDAALAPAFREMEVPGRAPAPTDAAAHPALLDHGLSLPALDAPQAAGAGALPELHPSSIAARLATAPILSSIGTSTGRIPRPELATADGDLSSTPLAHVLVYMLEHRLDGTLVITQPDVGETFAVFVDGAPVKSHSETGVSHLGDVLVRMGVTNEATIRAAVGASGPLRMLLGEFLLREQVVTRAQVDNALRIQLVERLARLSHLGAESHYAFYQGLDLIEGRSGEPVYTSPLNAILAVVRGWGDEEKIHKTLQRFARAPLRLHAEADLGAFAFAPEEAPLLAALGTGTTTVVEWSYRQGVDVHAMLRVLYTLAVTRQFLLSGQTKAPLRGTVPGEFLPPLVVGGQWQQPAPPSAHPVLSRREDVGGARRPLIRPIAAGPRSISHDGAPQSLRGAPAPAVRPAGAHAPEPTPPPRGGARVLVSSSHPEAVNAADQGPGSRPPGSAPPGSQSRGSAGPSSQPRSQPPASSPSGSFRHNAEPPAPLSRVAGQAPAVRAPSPGPMVRPVATPPRPAVPPAPAIPRIAPKVPPVPVPRAPIPVAKIVPKTISRGANSPAEPAAAPRPAPARPVGASVPEPHQADRPNSAEPNSSGADRARTALRYATEAETALENGDFDAAETAIRAAMDLDATQVDYQALLVWIHSRQQPSRSTQALTVFDRILASTPDRIPVLLLRGKLRVELGKVVDAKADFESVLRLDAGNKDAKEALASLGG